MGGLCKRCLENVAEWLSKHFHNRYTNRHGRHTDVALQPDEHFECRSIAIFSGVVRYTTKHDHMTPAPNFADRDHNRCEICGRASTDNLDEFRASGARRRRVPVDQLIGAQSRPSSPGQMDTLVCLSVMSCVVQFHSV